MKQTVYLSDFIDAFQKFRPNNFSYEGLEALFEFFDQEDKDCGMETELDVIGICCDFSEYGNLTEFQKDYSDEYQSIEDIERETSVIRVGDDGFIIQQF